MFLHSQSQVSAAHARTISTRSSLSIPSQKHPPMCDAMWNTETILCSFPGRTCDVITLVSGVITEDRPRHRDS